MTAPTKNVVDLATASTLAAADKVLMVDISDTTEGPLGTVKIATITSLSAFFDVISAQGLTAVFNNGMVYVNSGGAITSSAGVQFDGASLGVGVTPNTWVSSLKAVQIGAGAAIFGHATIAGNAYFSANLYYDGADRYIGTGLASKYQQEAGVHSWSTAPSGTVGNAITFTEKARIDSDGLKFNGDTAAANALDDYEEGTWTPVFTCETPGDLTVGYNFQNGKYTKVGNLVTVKCFIFLTTFTHSTASGAVKITGLPFTASSDVNDAMGALSVRGFTIANYTSFAASIFRGTTYANLGMSGSGQDTSTLAITNFASGVSPSPVVVFTATYTV